MGSMLVKVETTTSAARLRLPPIRSLRTVSQSEQGGRDGACDSQCGQSVFPESTVSNGSVEDGDADCHRKIAG